MILTNNNSSSFKQLSLLLFFLLFSFAVLAQKPKLLAGPVVGSVTATSAKVWIGYTGKGKNALLLIDTADKKIHYPISESHITNAKGEVALTMLFENLQPGHYYHILIEIDGWGKQLKYGFQTLLDEPVKDFNFLLGSCLLLQTDILRIAYPGFKHFILNRMRQKNSDFMLWTGDNVYMLWKDHSSYDNMFKRYMKMRKQYKKLTRFLAHQPNVAGWDDHDFGPNDAGSDWHLKDSSLKVFKGFWPNTYPDNPSLYGNYFKYSYYDADFFMADNRYFRGTPGDTTAPFLGETQMLWLKQQLLASEATFKFIVIGTQVISEMGFGEKYVDYSRERRDLLDFIAQNNIKGVLFLTGDMHFTELCKKEWNGYPMYDYSCSPLTAPALPVRLVGLNKNPLRVEGTKKQGHNFGRISISGEKGNRLCTIETFKRNGKRKWIYSINQNELSVK
ncbi:MAG: alkaline phosphatase family protein [Chitinophagales bacterium]|nr:alkaline phosphatase family protein [Chitinophagales bacterium]